MVVTTTFSLLGVSELS